MSKPFVWSWTSLNQFENCPLAFQMRYVDKKVKFESSEAASWGIKVHKSLDARLRAGVPLPSEVSPYEKWAETVEKMANGHELYTEKPLGINKNWGPVDPFSPICWGKGKADVIVVKDGIGYIFDWKTGKKNTDTTEAEIFTCMFDAQAHLQEYRYKYVWLKSDEATPEKGRNRITSKEIPELQEKLSARVGRLEDAIKSGTFKPRPSGLCDWCDYNKQLGCPYARK
ncbi:MAG: PD-(D/E)XK nuclease family protein [Magnetococcus sp. WYHC-3]